MLTQPKSVLLIENGGCRPNAVGFCVLLDSKFRFIIKVRLPDTMLISVFAAPSLFQWHLFTISHIGLSITSYVDGVMPPHTHLRLKELSRGMSQQIQNSTWMLGPSLQLGPRLLLMNLMCGMRCWLLRQYGDYMNIYMLEVYNISIKNMTGAPEPTSLWHVQCVGRKLLQ